MSVSGYVDKVQAYLINNPNTTNIDLLEFGLSNNFLPKHTKVIQDEIKKTHKLQVTSLDGKPAISYYIGDKKRLVNIKLLN